MLQIASAAQELCVCVCVCERESLSSLQHLVKCVRVAGMLLSVMVGESHLEEQAHTRLGCLHPLTRRYLNLLTPRSST